MKVIERLFELQELELGPNAGSAEAKRTSELIRKETPETILGHYDRLMARGKKAIAIVRRDVCTGCQMKLPSGPAAALKRDSDIAMCENCSRYLLLAPEELPAQLPQSPKLAAGRSERKKTASTAPRARRTRAKATSQASSNAVDQPQDRADRT